MIKNVPINHNFLQSVAESVIEKYPDYLELSSVTIFLPTRRCCREIKRIFLDISTNQLIILPKLKALSDISPEDFLLTSNSSCQKITPLAYRLLLTEQIIKWNQKTQIFGKVNLVKFLNIAEKIIFFLECLEKEKTSLDKIYELEDFDLAISKQKIIDFITNFVPFWRNFFRQKNFQTNIEVYNENIEQIISQISQCDFIQNPIIIAGSTGSFEATGNIIAEILKFPENQLILYGIDRDFLANNRGSIPKSHPQYNISCLLRKLEIDTKDIHDLKYKKYQQRHDDIKKVINNISLPSDQTYFWAENKNDVNFQALEKIKIFIAENHYQESKIISQQIVKILGTTNKTIALISNDQDFCQMVKLHLRRKEVVVDDSYNLNIADLAVSRYWFLLLEIFNSESFATNLLNLLKNPLTNFLSFTQKNQLIQVLEEQIFRKIPGKKKFDDIVVLAKKIENQDFQNSFALLQKILHPILQLKQQNEVSAEEILEKSISVLWELVLREDIENFVDFNDFIEDLLRNLSDLENKFQISYEFSGGFFRSLAAINKINKKVENFHNRIKILSQLEARLLNYDLLIISGLNEGEFTSGQNQNSWIGKKICNQLGIFDVEQKNSMTFYDFCHYLGGKEVVLSYSRFKNNLPTIKSNILFRLEIFAQIVGYKIEQISVNKDSKSLPQSQDRRYIQAPLKHLSITDISHWQRDPYYIYAKRILKLKKLEQLDRNPSFAEFGNFIHKIAEEFTKNFHNKNSLQDNCRQIYKLADDYFLEFFFQEENRVLWQKKIDYILDYLVKYEMAIAPDLQDVFTELSCNFSIKNTNISGKIDRINIFTDHIEIIDYKTGTIAQKQEIQNGLEPQLVVSLIAFIKQFGAEKISDKKNSLFYKILKIKEIKENEVKKEFFKKEDEIGNLKQEAQIGLEGLIDIFDNNQKFYPCPNEEIYKKNDYQHLERKG